MRKVETDLSKLDDLIARQYEDKIRGFIKDSLQNSWEARINRKKGTDFRMLYQFYNDLDGMKNVLMLEDFGTKGMDDERWKAFHSGIRLLVASCTSGSQKPASRSSRASE